MSEAFLKTLPADAFTEDEHQLRKAIFGFLSWHQEPATLVACSSDETVQHAQQKLLPAECPLEDWINGRIGEDVAITQEDESGQWVLHAQQSSIDAHKREEESHAEGEAFFAELPQHTFTLEEDQLREALGNFLRNWSKPSPPLLSDAGTDPAVRDARNALLPRTRDALRENVRQGSHPRVSLTKWLERRVADEFETADVGRNFAFGWKGALDEDAVSRLAASLADKEPNRKREVGSGSVKAWTANHLKRKAQH